jgi:hypothetical protein
MLAAAVALLGPAPTASAQSNPTEAEIQRILQELRSEDRVQATAAAISCQHLVRRQSTFSLFDRPELRWWQQALLPAVPPLVEMLADERGMEWVDGNGNTEQVTTARREARLTLVALGRASIDGLIAALDRRELARKADEVLRQIVGSGPPDARKASWERHWAERRGQALPTEQGRFLQVLLGTVLLAGAVALVFWLQRLRQRALEAKRLRLATTPAPAPAPAPAAPPAQNV